MSEKRKEVWDVKWLTGEWVMDEALELSVWWWIIT